MAPPDELSNKSQRNTAPQEQGQKPENGAENNHNEAGPHGHALSEYHNSTQAERKEAFSQNNNAKLEPTLSTVITEKQLSDTKARSIGTSKTPSFLEKAYSVFIPALVIGLAKNDTTLNKEAVLVGENPVTVPDSGKSYESDALIDFERKWEKGELTDPVEQEALARAIYTNLHGKGRISTLAHVFNPWITKSENIEIKDGKIEKIIFAESIPGGISTDQNKFLLGEQPNGNNYYVNRYIWARNYLQNLKPPRRDLGEINRHELEDKLQRIKSGLQRNEEREISNDYIAFARSLINQNSANAQESIKMFLLKQAVNKSFQNDEIKLDSGNREDKNNFKNNLNAEANRIARAIAANTSINGDLKKPLNQYAQALADEYNIDDGMSTRHFLADHGLKVGDQNTKDDYGLLVERIGALSKEDAEKEISSFIVQRAASAGSINLDIHDPKFQTALTAESEKVANTIYADNTGKFDKSLKLQYVNFSKNIATAFGVDETLTANGYAKQFGVNLPAAKQQLPTQSAVVPAIVQKTEVPTLQKMEIHNIGDLTAFERDFYTRLVQTIATGRTKTEAESIKAVEMSIAQRVISTKGLNITSSRALNPSEHKENNKLIRLALRAESNKFLTVLKSAGSSIDPITQQKLITAANKLADNFNIDKDDFQPYLVNAGLSLGEPPLIQRAKNEVSSKLSWVGRNWQYMGLFYAADVLANMSSNLVAKTGIPYVARSAEFFGKATSIPRLFPEKQLAALVKVSLRAGLSQGRMNWVHNDAIRSLRYIGARQSFPYVGVERIGSWLDRNQFTDLANAKNRGPSSEVLIMLNNVYGGFTSHSENINISKTNRQTWSAFYEALTAENENWSRLGSSWFSTEAKKLANSTLAEVKQKRDFTQRGNRTSESPESFCLKKARALVMSEMNPTHVSNYQALRIELTERIKNKADGQMLEVDACKSLIEQSRTWERAGQTVESFTIGFNSRAEEVVERPAREIPRWNRYSEFSEREIERVKGWTEQEKVAELTRRARRVVFEEAINAASSHGRDFWEFRSARGDKPKIDPKKAFQRILRLEANTMIRALADADPNSTEPVLEHVAENLRQETLITFPSILAGNPQESLYNILSRSGFKDYLPVLSESSSGNRVPEEERTARQESADDDTRPTEREPARAREHAPVSTARAELRRSLIDAAQGGADRLTTEVLTRIHDGARLQCETLAKNDSTLKFDKNNEHANRIYIAKLTEQAERITAVVQDISNESGVDPDHIQDCLDNVGTVIKSEEKRLINDSKVTPATLLSNAGRPFGSEPLARSNRPAEASRSAPAASPTLDPSTDVTGPSSSDDISRASGYSDLDLSDPGSRSGSHDRASATGSDILSGIYGPQDELNRPATDSIDKPFTQEEREFLRERVYTAEFLQNKENFGLDATRNLAYSFELETLAEQTEDPSKAELFSRLAHKITINQKGNSPAAILRDSIGQPTQAELNTAIEKLTPISLSHADMIISQLSIPSNSYLADEIRNKINPAAGTSRAETTTSSRTGTADMSASGDSRTSGSPEEPIPAEQPVSRSSDETARIPTVPPELAQVVRNGLLFQEGAAKSMLDEGFSIFKNEPQNPIKAEDIDAFAETLAENAEIQSDYPGRFDNVRVTLDPHAPHSSIEFLYQPNTESEAVRIFSIEKIEGDKFTGNTAEGRKIEGLVADLQKRITLKLDLNDLNSHDTSVRGSAIGELRRTLASSLNSLALEGSAYKSYSLNTFLEAGYIVQASAEQGHSENVAQPHQSVEAMSNAPERAAEAIRNEAIAAEAGFNRYSVQDGVFRLTRNDGTVIADRKTIADEIRKDIESAIEEAKKGDKPKEVTRLEAELKKFNSNPDQYLKRIELFDKWLAENDTTGTERGAGQGTTVRRFLGVAGGAVGLFVIGNAAIRMHEKLTEKPHIELPHTKSDDN